MVSSSSTKDYLYLRSSEAWKQSKKNEEYIQKFITRKRAAGVSLNAINCYVTRILSWLKDFDKEDVKDVTSEDVLAAYFERMDKVSAKEYSAATLDGDVVALKQFMQFLHGVEKSKEIVQITRRRTKNKKLSTDYITMEDVKRMRNYAESTGDIRGVALIMICIGTGARISEILDAKVKDLTIKQYNAVLNVDGKTGQRSIPFVIGMPELLTWLNAHPKRGQDGKVDPEAPIFVTKNTRGNGVQKLSRKRVEAYFSLVAKNVGISKDVKSSPHAFRHLLATIMAKKLTIKEMNLFFGWSASSTTALTYIHTSQHDLECNILSINGVSVQEEETGETEMVIQCPSCGKILAAGTKWCPVCRMILDPVLAVQINDVYKDMARKDVVEKYVEMAR